MRIGFGLRGNRGHKLKKGNYQFLLLASNKQHRGNDKIFWVIFVFHTVFLKKMTLGENVAIRCNEKTKMGKNKGNTPTEHLTEN